MPIKDVHTGLDSIADVARGDVDKGLLNSDILDGKVVLLKGRERDVVVGRSVPVKVNTNIGISDKSSSLSEEVAKLETLSNANFRPDMIMDHTIIHEHRDFWRTMVNEFDGPVGTLPHYTAYTPQNGFDPRQLLDRIEEMLSGGVSFMTLHPTADLDIYQVAQKTRPIPVTSRGGGLVIRDQLRSGRNANVFMVIFEEMTQLFKKYGAAISVGTTFRPPDIFSALDEAHRMETGRQISIVKQLKNAGVKVLMEGVGHVPLHKIEEYTQLVKEAECPFMPLGPMTTDSSIGFDHVTSAIGGAYMAHLGGAHILNSVTREEHTGGVPSIESIIEGLKASRVAAHSVNVTRFPSVAAFDKLTIQRRGEAVSCVVSGGLFGTEVSGPNKGCTRCSFECPIVLAPAHPHH